GLKGKTVLISGASGGIGSEIARIFDNEGAKLVLTYLSDSRGESEIKELKKALNGEHIVISADLTVESEVDKIFSEADKKYGRIDAMVACAGVWSETKYIADRTLDEWNRAFQLNSTADFLLARGFFRNLRKYPADNASVVFIGSTAGVIGESQHHDYAATKAAIIFGLAQTLRVEIIKFAKKGRVNVVNPGWTATPITYEMLKDKQFVHTITSTIPLRKVATPKDIASSVVFLSSDVLAGHITGEIVTVAGGLKDRLYHGELKQISEDLKPY
ncbi:MAG: SDR family NAD(P)-dependent oxidoreductase, partial [Actinomycetota bacterium]|nr:SDR family NAD(P)-dependent oxidoreductase [Actinomycetota bacterium]